MKHNCPHCHGSLKWRLVGSKPLSGERKVLPNQGTQVCPMCQGAIAQNTHWGETVAGVVMCLSIVMCMAAKPYLSTVEAGWIVAGVLVLWVGMLVYLHLRYWRNWPRYRKVNRDDQKTRLSSSK